MDKVHPSAVLAMWLVYAILALVLIGIRIIPLGNAAGTWPGPDLLLCMTFAWVLRRPEQVPPLLIAGAFLVADLILTRAPGLWSALALISSEILRGRAATGRPLSLPAEWGLVIILLISMTVAEWLALVLTLAFHPSLAQLLVEAATTCAAYPLVALALRLAGLRRREYAQNVIRGART